MSTVPMPQRDGLLQMSGVSWPEYTHLLRAFARRPSVRLTYDRGDLEIMSPSLQHDDDSDLLGDLVFILTEERGLPFKRGGSVTLRRRRLRRGLEPDRCYWIANAAAMRGVRRLNLRIHPPPDLAIEIEVSRRALDRLAIYARLGVPEVWRLEAAALTFHVLQSDGTYAVATHSRAFPGVTPSDLLGFLRLTATTDEHVVTAQFRQWVRQQLVPPAP